MVDLEQFREAVKQAYGYYPVVVDGELHNQRDADRFAGFRLLSIIDNAGKAGGVDDAAARVWEAMQEAGYLFSGGPLADAHPDDQQHARRIALAALSHQPAAVVDDAMVQRALNAKIRNWPVRQLFDSECEARIAMRAALTAALSSVQGVDLGQFREAVVSWRSLYHGSTPEAGERHSEADRLLAIIDDAKAVPTPATSGLVEALRGVVEAYDTLDNGRMLRWAIDDARAALADHDASIGK